MIKVRAWNSEAQKARLQSIGTGERSGSGKFFKLGDWSAVYFHLMQPWNERGMLFREVFECFNLPPPPGKKWARHTAWKTWEHEEPGISLKDPVIRVLEEYKDSLKDVVQKIRPSPKYYCNILVIGTQKVNKDGSLQADSYEEQVTPQVYTLALTPPVCREIMKYLDQALKTAAGTLTNPFAAGLFSLAKVEKQQEGRTQTAYIVKVMGTEVPPQGMVPNRYNLVEKYGEERMAYLDNNLPDLDAMYPVPTEGQRVEAELLARVLKEKLSIALSKTKTAKEVGATETKDGTLVVAPPTQPAQPAPPPPSSSPAATPPPAETKVEVQGPPPAPPPAASEAPPPATGAITSKDIMTRNLGLTDAPRTPDNKPVCFAHYSHVSTSPNGKWCESCTWRRPCKLTESKEKEKKQSEPQAPTQ